MLVDLPAFDRPTKAISGTSSAGRWLSCGAVVKKRAVCSQFSATSARESGGSGGLRWGGVRVQNGIKIKTP